MLGRFFDTVEVDRYADWVVSELKRSLPHGFDPSSKKTAEHAQKLNERLDQRTDEFTQSVALNIYKKAHLAARVRESMNAHGYAEPFVKSFSYDLLARIQLAANRRTR